VWEPLFIFKKTKIKPFAYPEIHEVGFDWNQHIPENEKWDMAFIFFRKLFNREIINLKLYRFNNLKKIKNTDLFIYKFCFGHLMMPWLVNNFDLNPILLIRHPCAVVSSQLKRGFSFKKEYIGRFFKGKYKDIYIKYKTVFEEIKTDEEYLAALWAITNIYPIKHVYNNKKWLTVAYEGLLMNQEFELTRISDWFKIDIKNNETFLSAPSFTTDDKLIVKKKTQITKWKTQLSNKQVLLILNIVKKFGVDFYSEEIEPNYEVLYN